MAEVVPLCPECGTDARRGKCLWELGGDCPRHAVLRAWKAAQPFVGPWKEWAGPIVTAVPWWMRDRALEAGAGC